MKIGPPLKALPEALTHYRAKYRPAYEAAVAAVGEWVPIEFDTKEELRLFRMAATSHRSVQFEVKQRRLTAYIRTKPDANGNGLTNEGPTLVTPAR